MHEGAIRQLSFYARCVDEDLHGILATCRTCSKIIVHLLYRKRITKAKSDS
jgi:hypothetical protein